MRHFLKIVVDLRSIRAAPPLASVVLSDRRMTIGKLVASVGVVLVAGAWSGCAATPEWDEEGDFDGEEPNGEIVGSAGDGTVAGAASATCSTASVKGLSQQIIDEAACIDPNAYVLVPSRPNLTIKDNVFAYLEKPAKDALVKALDANPSKTLSINSMLRTVAQQYLLYRWYQTGSCGIGLAAKPGNSNHETGLALDTSDYSKWKSAFSAVGFSWLGANDPPHFDYKGQGAKSYKGMDVLAFQRLWNRNHPEDKISEDGSYGPQTEARLKKAPASGFTKGAICGASDEPADPSDPADPNDPSGIWTPAPGTSWQWVLSGDANLGLGAEVFDLDGFETTESTVASLHAKGKKAICYLSAGSYEDWRPDAGQFPSKVLGNDYDGWAGEKWLDIRQIDALAPILGSRLDMCKQKGFDAIEPDNIDGYTNDTGFPLTAADQKKFNLWLAGEAHSRGLSIGLKNDQDQAADLVSAFDWALTEDCFDQGWCEDMSVFVNAGKAVFAAEYTDTGMTLSKFCGDASSLKFSGILKHRDLDDWVSACP